MANLSSKVVLIRGAGNGLGRALALGFAEHGAAIAATGTSPHHLEKTAETIRAKPGECRIYDHDMSKKHFIQGTIEDIQSRWGSVDIFVQAQFLNPKGSLELIDAWDWQHSLDVNLSGTLYTVQSFLRIAENTPAHKHIIIVLPGTAHSGLEIMKFGLLGIAATAAKEGIARGVSVNALSSLDVEEETLARNVYRLCGEEEGAITGQLLAGQSSLSLDTLPL